MRKINEKGITIINLVITILVLMIIAIIGIGILRDGKIIETSQGAANLHKRGEYDEALQLAVIETQIDYISQEKNIDKGYFEQIKGIIEPQDIYKGATIKLIKYERNGGIIHENPADNEVNAIYIVTKEGFVFIVDENLVVYDGEGVQYEDIKTGILSYDYDKAWTNKTLPVTIKKNTELESDDYTIQYKIGQEDWKKYTGALQIQENCTIDARIIDKNKRVVVESQEEITNIDKTPPIAENFKLEKASCLKANTSVDIQDADSGISKIIYYYSNNGGSSYNNKEVAITDNSTEKTTKTQELELAAGTYTIYVEVYDKAGNKAETEKKTITLGHNSVYGGTSTVHTKCSVCGITLSSTHSYTSTTYSTYYKYTCACGYYYTVNRATSTYTYTYTTTRTSTYTYTYTTTRTTTKKQSTTKQCTPRTVSYKSGKQSYYYMTCT